MPCRVFLLVSDYPEWLWRLHIERTPIPLGELKDRVPIAYWRRVQSYNSKRVAKVIAVNRGIPSRTAVLPFAVKAHAIYGEWIDRLEDWRRARGEAPGVVGGGAHGTVKPAVYYTRITGNTKRAADHKWS